MNKFANPLFFLSPAGRLLKSGCITIAACVGVKYLPAQQARITLELDKPGVTVSASLYGLMTEEINHSYDGGLYAELIRNRIFKDNDHSPEAWHLVQAAGSEGQMRLIAPQPENVPKNQEGHAINDALTTCLQLTVTRAGSRTGIANEGYWGIPVHPVTNYLVSFYAKGGYDKNNPILAGAAETSAGPLTVTLENSDGSVTYASGTVELEKSPYWKKYALRLTTRSGFTPTSDARFVISTARTGTYYFNLVSLFPPTWQQRPNGNRSDIMQLLADMKPAFLRFPGGNFLEGDYFSTRFNWKNTLGPLEQRPGHQGNWLYRATDGMGLLEFLEWCEDLHMEPVLAVYAGYSLKGDHVDAGPLLQPYINDALEEIEYVTGDVHTTWGAKRAADGHPAPFSLRFIEIGNEDWFDKSGSYNGRFTQFSQAIKARYPHLRCISTVPDDKKSARVSSVKPDIIDEHYYRTAWQMQEDAQHYDGYSRTSGTTIFVGEWATREGTPTTNMNAALGDAVWMTGMERNSDIVQLSCYAPLFANVNKAKDSLPRGWQWESNLIGYDALHSYGSPSYYAQKMFSTHLGNKVVPITAVNIPVKHATKQDSLHKTLPKITTLPALYYVATRDTASGTIYLKVINTSAQTHSVRIQLNGVATIAREGTVTVLKGDGPEDTNTIDSPLHIVPVTSRLKNTGKQFTYSLAPFSIHVIQLQAQ